MLIFPNRRQTFCIINSNATAANFFQPHKSTDMVQNMEAKIYLKFYLNVLVVLVLVLLNDFLVLVLVLLKKNLVLLLVLVLLKYILGFTFSFSFTNRNQFT